MRILAALAIAIASCSRAPAQVTEDPPLPGIAAPSERLARSLADALARQGPRYQPRTRQLTGDGAPRFTNRLILETSPYLLQHAHNPVNWYAWGDEPFDRARREGKLVLLSIGYSTCHWCHVMERESFDDEEVARYLNENFVCIKVDREERPDVDDVYMQAVKAMRGSGGWPMTVFVTAAREPFFAGTYLPREHLLAVAREIRERQASDASTIASAATRTLALLRRDPVGAPGTVPDRDAIARVVRDLARAFDVTWGGFGAGTKFPQAPTLDLLLRYHRATGDTDALRMVTLTLERMQAGGIADQLGGGFHRYATDAQWRVPHFEKMLYDQAQLAAIYLDAAQVTGRADFSETARRTLDYVLRDLQDPGGGFYSASDADSATPDGGDEEGAYFTWTRAELEAALGPVLASVAATYYGVGAGRSVLYVPKSLDEAASQLRLSSGELAVQLARARELLLAARTRRPPPRIDDKIVTAWNGLAISALARGAFVLDRPDYAVAAERAATLLLERLRDRDGRIARSYRAGVRGAPGVLQDYAFVIAGLLDLFEADGDPRWLDEAVALQHVLDRDFAAPGGGYFASASDSRLLVRDRPIVDGAEPSGNAVALANLVRLAAITGDDAWQARAEAGFATFSEVFMHGGAAAPRLASAIEASRDGVLEIALVAPRDRDEVAPLLDVVRRTYVPDRVVVRVIAGAPLAQLATHLPWLDGKLALAGRPTAFVCERGACKLPTSSPDELARQLHARR